MLTIPSTTETRPSPASLSCENDDTISSSLAWQTKNLRTSLVTLVGIDGASPRPLGAQMAVAENGNHVGYLSGGCFENAVVAHAIHLIKEQKNALVRYGKGSSYFDVKLPCGSGLDLYFDQRVSINFLKHVQFLFDNRTPMSVAIDLKTGDKKISPIESATNCLTQKDGDIFRATYLPRIRALVAGHGKMFSAIARLLNTCGFELHCITHDEHALSELLASGLNARRVTTRGLPSVTALDRYSAVILAFHEHEHEMPILEYALKSDSFYVGALGGRLTSSERRARLEQRGFSQFDIDRIRSPIGLIPNAKSGLSAATSILAEVVLEAMRLKIID